MSSDLISIHGARQHNLKDIDISIPKDKFVVITGVSGSGKSSLAFDTIYAEGQRRYVESLSAYARQFLGLMHKPDVDHIEGLSPAISIDQKSAGHNPRSTVGTVTEIYDYLRLLFARAGTPHCPNCGKIVKAQSVQEMVDSIIRSVTKKDQKIMILGPVIKKRKGSYDELFSSLLSKGYVRARVDGNVRNLEDNIVLDRYKIHSIEVVLDRLVLSPSKKKDPAFTKRLTDSIETALNLGEGELIVVEVNGKEQRDKLFSENFACSDCDISFPAIEPHTFSFNSPYGACKSCAGLGTIQKVSPELIYNPNLTINEGGIYPWSRSWDNAGSWYKRIVTTVAEKYDIPLRKPLSDLTRKQLDTILYGTGNETHEITYTSNGGGQRTIDTKYEGVIPNLERRYKETESDYIRNEIEGYMRTLPCNECEGQRLNEFARSVKIGNHNIVTAASSPINQAIIWVRSLQDASSPLTKTQKSTVEQVLKELAMRLTFLVSVGLDYLTLNRTARTLSGGEAQRIRLASQIGTGLTGVLYVLDEPSIGLHQRDNKRLLDTLKNLRDLGNTVLVVEHDEDTIRQADHIIDIGPYAGEHGGKVVAQGNPEDIISNKASITGKYLSGKQKISRTEVEKRLKKMDMLYHPQGNVLDKKFLTIRGARQHNLKGIDVSFPLSKFVCVTGVSGSGKSSLVNDILYRSIARDIYGSKTDPGNHTRIEGVDYIDKIININQSPIGRTPRSNPATYTGVFTPIRDIFAKTKEAKSRGYSPGRFSFNVKGGRCENCRGDGVIRIEMQFLPDVYVECEVCNGKRYNREVLQIDYKGKTISDVLDMTVEEALAFFENIPAIRNKIQTLTDVGLGYIHLGQPATTLSGGEAQRIKLASELSKRSTGKTVYILDEPTTGLHFFDVDNLLTVLHGLVAKGNTVITIEHNLDFIATADWIIDLGPEGGDEGGEIVAQGSVKDIIDVKESYTGQWLKTILQ